MKPREIQELLVSDLEEHRLRIITRWRNELSTAECFFLFRMYGSTHWALAAYFQEIMRLASHGPLNIPRLPSQPFPMDGPRNEILLLLTGEGVVMRVLKKHHVFTDKIWLEIRLLINQVFHEAIRNNCVTACNCCRWAISENFAVLKKLEKAQNEQAKIQF